MADLLEITPSSRKVKTARLGEVDIPGLTLEGISFLFKRHPEFAQFIEGGGLDTDDITKLLDLGMSFVSSFLAVGMGYQGDEKVEKLCLKLTPGDIFTIGKAILDESFPEGSAGFFKLAVKEVMQYGSAQKTVNVKPSKSITKNPSSKPSRKVASG